jgi:hypothetical protein
MTVEAERAIAAAAMSDVINRWMNVLVLIRPDSAIPMLPFCYLCILCLSRDSKSPLAGAFVCCARFSALRWRCGLNALKRAQRTK